MSVEIAPSPAGVSPPATPEVKVQTPAPAPAAPGSSLQQPAAQKEPRTIAAINARIAEAMKAAPPPAPTPPAEAPPAAAPEAETPAPEGAAPETETPAGETTETPPTDEPEVEIPEEEADGPITPTTAKRPRISMAPDDVFGRTLASIKSRNKDWSTQEAIAATYRQLGLKPDAGNGAEAPATPAPKSDLPETVEDVDQAVKSLLAERRKANSETRFEDADDIDIKIRNLDQHRFSLLRDADRKQMENERKQVKVAQEYDTKFTASETKATELYAFASEPDSPGGKLMKQFDQQLEDSGDPRFHSPDKPLLCAHWAAAKLNVPPRLKGATPAPAKAAVPATPAPPKAKVQQLPNGSSRTTPPPVNTLSPVDALVQNNRPKTMADLRALHKKLGLQ